jgi:hypothetical protein
VNGNVADIAVGHFALASMKSGADFDAKWTDFIGNSAGTSDAASWTVKGGKNAVAGRFDPMTAKARQVAPDGGVMIVEKIAPAAVAERGRTRCLSWSPNSAPTSILSSCICSPPWLRRSARSSAYRTKAALAAAKARGVRLGNPRLDEARKAAHKAAAAANEAAAERHAATVLPIIREIRKAGATTLREIAAALNARGVQTARGGQWHAMTVSNVLARA